MWRVRRIGCVWCSRCRRGFECLTACRTQPLGDAILEVPVEGNCGVTTGRDLSKIHDDPSQSGHDHEP